MLVCILCVCRVEAKDVVSQKNPPDLSLDDAILLAVRSNPNVQSTRLNDVSQKFNLWVQEWEFYPHYSLQAGVAYNRNQAPGFFSASSNANVQPSVSWQSPIGTQVTLSANNPSSNQYNPGVSLQIMQPLLKGFGKPVVEASLNNARDSVVISRLNVEGILRATVSDVVNAYLNVVSAERTVEIDKDAVSRTEKSVEQTKLFIKAGHKAGNELVTVEANVASAKTQLENDLNNLAQARYGLLAAIGIDPNANIHFSSLNVEQLIEKYHLPTLNNTKKWALENDIQYQTEEITLHGQTKRNLLVAEDNTRWQLNFNADLATGNGTGSGENAGWNSVVNGTNQAQSVSLTLQVPIDDQASKQAVLNAKIALKQAELALLQDKWNKETNAINSWNNVVSAERALRFADDAEKLQQKTYEVSYQKYLHGLIDSLELQSAQVSLIQAQQAALNSRIGYLRALVNLDLVTGNTLRTWKINVRL